MSITGKEKGVRWAMHKKPTVAEVCLIFNYLSVWPLLKGESTPDVAGTGSKNLLTLTMTSIMK